MIVRVFAWVGLLAFCPIAGITADVPLNAEKSVLMNREAGTLTLQAKVVLRAGMLEMLACLQRTKEHEAILAVPCQAKTVHAGLLALGLHPGETARFDPEFQPPTGAKLKIELVWKDAAGNEQRALAQSWIRHATSRFFVRKLEVTPPDLQIDEGEPLRWDGKHKELMWYGPMTAEQRDQYLPRSRNEAYQAAIRYFFEVTQSRPLAQGWVFCGSGFRKNDDTGEEIYLGEAGDLICVANFVTAVIDLDGQSSAQAEGLTYEAWTERIPPKETPVAIVISAAPPAESLPPATSPQKTPN